MEKFEGTHSSGSLGQVTRGLERLEGFYIFNRDEEDRKMRLI